MPLMQDVIGSAPELAAAIVQDWIPTAAVAPLSRIPAPIDQNNLAELIRRLGEAAEMRATTGESPSKELIRAAFEHGRERQEDGFSEDMLLREYHLLRRALWNSLRRTDPTLASETIIRIDAEITMATGASLRGYHVEGVDLNENSLIDEIAEQWSTRRA